MIAFPSIRSVKPVGGVKLGFPSATQVAVIVAFDSERVSALKDEEVEEAFCETFTPPIGES